MYTLQNEFLQVTILDPEKDRLRLGPRYCHGGYIFQIADHTLGPLLSGPTYPNSFNIFDGQGLPEAFNLSPLRTANETSTEALVLGVGICNFTTNFITDWSEWGVTTEPSRIVFQTSHIFGGFAADIVRVITLNNRTVRSETKLTNLGEHWIPLRWFPHPFFPQPNSDELCKFNITVKMDDNPGYTLGTNGFLNRKGWPWTEGFFLPLQHDANTNLIVHQRHPVLGLVTATCSYTPAYFPVWGNPCTFSWEPFLERTIGPRQNFRWWIDYDF